MRTNLMPFAIAMVSIFSILLIVVRIAYSNQIAYLFLIWNLFLAWLPLLFAWLALRWRDQPLATTAAAILWLLFFPNAPYLVTDLIHLRSIPPVPLWYDLIVLLDFALLGLALGCFSLRLMQELIDRRFGRPAAWSFVLLVLGISGLGVFIGRFLRWNSWDLFLRPLPLLLDVWSRLGEPRTIVVSGLLALLLLFAYLLFFMTHGPLTKSGDLGEPDFLSRKHAP